MWNTIHFIAKPVIGLAISCGAAGYFGRGYVAPRVQEVPVVRRVEVTRFDDRRLPDFGRGHEIVTHPIRLDRR